MLNLDRIEAECKKCCIDDLDPLLCCKDMHSLISELREARARNEKLRVWVTELTCGEAYDLERCRGCGLVGACADIAECLAEGDQ